MTRIARVCVLVVALAFLAPACSVDGLAFHEDTRVHFVAPARRATVQQPVTVRWRVRDFTASGPDGSRRDDRGYFAVFVDRSPLRPGQSLRSLASGDSACLHRAGCPDDEWLTAHRVYTSSTTSVTISSLADKRTHPRAKDRHDLVLVLLNGRGERIGESAFRTDFVLDRGDR